MTGTSEKTLIAADSNSSALLLTSWIHPDFISTLQVLMLRNVRLVHMITRKTGSPIAIFSFMWCSPWRLFTWWWPLRIGTSKYLLQATEFLCYYRIWCSDLVIRRSVPEWATSRLCGLKSRAVGAVLPSTYGLSLLPLFYAIETSVNHNGDEQVSPPLIFYPVGGVSYWCGRTDFLLFCTNRVKLHCPIIYHLFFFFFCIFSFKMEDRRGMDQKELKWSEFFKAWAIPHSKLACNWMPF